MGALAHSLGHLIHLANQYKDRLVENHVAEYGVTAAQFKVLLLLARDGLDTPAALCRPLSLDSGAMTRMLDRLESKGLLERVRSTEDRRQIRLQLTEQGRAFSNQICQIASQVTSELTRTLTPEEIDEFQRLLRKLLAPYAPEFTGDTRK
jgi:DNA-binding MarR family transcriptional regulator